MLLQDRFQFSFPMLGCSFAYHLPTGMITIVTYDLADNRNNVLDYIK